MTTGLPAGKVTGASVPTVKQNLMHGEKSSIKLYENTNQSSFSSYVITDARTQGLVPMHTAKPSWSHGFQPAMVLVGRVMGKCWIFVGMGKTANMERNADMLTIQGNSKFGKEANNSFTYYQRVR